MTFLDTMRGTDENIALRTSINWIDIVGGGIAHILIWWRLVNVMRWGILGW